MHRPFKMGAQIEWKPVGNWFTLGALLGFGVKEPFSSDAHGYVEYKVLCNFDLFVKNWNILGLRLYTAYLDEVFKHSAGIVLNFRAIEIDAGIAAVSSSFVSSFKGSGISAYFMFAIGF